MQNNDKFSQSLKENLWLFAVALLACFAVSAVVRYQQFETWEKTPQAYFVGERPMMTTLDAPYWLRLARELNEGVYGQKDGLRGYPDSSLRHSLGNISVPQNLLIQIR